MMDFGGLVNAFNPRKVEGYFKKEMPNASWGGVAINAGIAIAVVTIMALLVTALSTVFSGVLMTAMGAPAAGFTPGIASFVFILIVAVVSFIGFFVSGFILHFIAKALGGQGNAVQLLYLMSIGALAVSPIWALAYLLSAIPCVGCLLLLLGLIPLVYSLYLYYVAAMLAHKLDSGKAAIAVVGWVIVLAVIFAILFVIMAMLIGASLYGLGAASGMTSNYYP